MSGWIELDGTANGRLQAVIICNLICIAAAADGYQYTMNGTNNLGNIYDMIYDI